VRALGFVGLVSVVAYCLTPTTALGPEGDPTQVFVTANLRYLTPALLIGMVLLASAPFLHRPGRRHAVVVLLASVVIASLPARGWVAWPQQHRWAAIGGALAAVTAGVVVLRLWRSWPTPRVPLAVAAALLVVLLAWPAQRGYFITHYRQDPRWGLAPVFAWAATQRHQRIGVVGVFQQYPFFGDDLTNHVQYVGRRRSDGGFGETRSCREWRSELAAGRFDYVVAAPYSPERPVPRQAAWTEGDPAVTEVLRTGKLRVYRIHGPLDPRRCP
jgi:hypothetical protein